MINVNLIYPVGSIYMSIDSKNPSNIFGGTWERIKGKMLVGVDEDDEDFKQSALTGGEKEHTLTDDELAEHAHITPGAGNVGFAQGGYTLQANTSSGGANLNLNKKTNNAGGGQPHNNMPPFFTAYIWYRTA